MDKRYDDYVKDVVQRIHDEIVLDWKNVKEEKTEARQRSYSVQVVHQMLEDTQINFHGALSENNNIVDNDYNLKFLDVLESCYRNIKFYDDYAKHLFLIRGCSYTNNNDKRTRVGIRNLLNSTQINLNDYLDVYQDYALVTYDKNVHQNVKDKIKFLKNSEWITVYRGFNTKGTEEIRTSNNKNKADYYRQKEGMGFSFSLNKHVAYIFSYVFQNRLLESTHKHGKDATWIDLKSQIKHHENLIGRATIGRFVIHRDNIKGVTLLRGEDEIICDYRDAKLISYKFISDTSLQSKDLDKIYNGVMSLKVDYVKSHKDNWINKNWKNEYKVTKEQAKIFAKTKK
jgi:hypothetical protein